MRSTLLSAAALTCLVGLAAGPASADDTGVWKAFRGKIVASDAPFEGGYESDGAMIAGIRRQQRSTIKGADGQWSVNLMVFLKDPPNAESINIVYYDVTKKREQINFAEVSVQPTQKTIQINGNVLSKEMGFLVGHRYEILATRLVSGKEVVYARATVTLK